MNYEYLIDVSSDASYERYKNGGFIAWVFLVRCKTQEEANRVVALNIKTGKCVAIRIVRLKDPEGLSEPEDVYTWFKYSKE